MGYCKVLGPVRAFDGDGRPRRLASEPQRRLVALLCLHQGSLVRSAVLQEHLGLSSGALRTSIARLRRVLGDDVLVTGSGGYELRAEVDVADFERLVDEAFASDSADAFRALKRADALWAGPPYVEFEHEQWAQAEACRLAELRAAALTELATILLDRDEEAQAMAVLIPLIDDYPYRDRPRGLLMRALCQSGRTTEALREFQVYRCRLSEDVGTEPSRALIELDRAIACGHDLAGFRIEPHPAWSRRTAPASPVDSRPRARLPAPLSSFVGRTREVAEVADQVQRHRVVTLTGGGGVGKSRLALRAATVLERRFDHTWWVGLGALAADGDVAEQIATDIGVVPRLDPASEVVRRLGDKQALLVVDNAEHVVDTTASVLIDVLTRCGHARALVTSREPLGVPGEVVWRVPALGFPAVGAEGSDALLDRHDAVRLFVERAREARPDLILDGPAFALVTAICQELDGMPLALELAAARLRNHPLERVAEDVSSIVEWKAPARHGGPERHSTLRASIEWSLDLVDPAEQDALHGLALFRSPFDLEAARAVAVSIDPADLADLLQRLVDLGLLARDDGWGRYRMLETVRQVCAERAEARGGAELARRAHAAYFARWCEDVGAGRHGIEHSPFVTRMPDVVAAMAWAREHDPSCALRMCRGLAPVRSALGHRADFDATWRWLVDIADDERSAAWAEAVAGLLPLATAFAFDTATPAKAADAFSDESPRVRSWLDRGRAMKPAFAGRPEQILAYAHGLLARGDDLEASVYAGFAAYTVALMGRRDECDALVEQLCAMTGGHDTEFSVDSVGNGYAAAIVVETLRGDLALAMDRSRTPVPTDPAFSMTSAAALAHCSLLAMDDRTMSRAREWATQGSFPLLDFLTPFTACCAVLLDGASGEAADLAMEFWDQAANVPVWRVHASTLVVKALLGVGRIDAADAMVGRSAELTAHMSTAPLMATSVHLARSHVALAQDRTDLAERDANAALDLARTHRLCLAAIDALEIRSVAAARRNDLELARSLRERAANERCLHGYHFSTLQPAGLAASIR